MHSLQHQVREGFPQFSSQKAWKFLPQAESALCYCGVDAGLTITNARRFVPGTRHCIQPDIKPTIKLRHHRSARHPDRSKIPSQLIPGLPDDLAIACLVRVPRIFHRILRVVCKRWYRLLAGNFFYSQRKALGMAEEWIYVIKRDRDGHISWHAFDPRYQQWQPLPPVPIEYTDALGFGCAVLSGCHLYLFGGKDPAKGSMRRVVYYSARTNKWHRAADMIRRRHFFGCCVINNCLYVAGGECEGVQRSLRSAEVYDPNRNKWSYIAEMSSSMVPFIGVVYHGRWFLKGLGSHRQVMSEVYFPATDNWAPAVDKMVSGWRNPSAIFNGELYALDCQDGCKLRVYDNATEVWNTSVDSRTHLGNSKALEAAALLPLGGKLCIIRNNMSITMVDVTSSEVRKGDHHHHHHQQQHQQQQQQQQMWDTIAGRGLFKNFVTNLWSNIAGRNRLKSHIVHCQVLQA